jgi:soluble lytic murein transglycosylase
VGTFARCPCQATAVAPSTRRKAPTRARRLTVWFAAALMLGAGGYVALHSYFRHAVKELRLPLQHDDIIRQQARAKGIDPSLIAAVIYTESHFRPRTSSAGAVGLMQVTPATADFIAHKSGGVRFETADLATPQINISYGTYYLRYLLRRFDADVRLGLAAYNGGEGNVERWLAEASARGEAFTVDAIPFTETREYVGKVLSAQRQYRLQWWRELGLADPR